MKALVFRDGEEMGGWVGNGLVNSLKLFSIVI